jgi:serine/threonine-protein kinase
MRDDVIERLSGEGALGEGHEQLLGGVLEFGRGASHHHRGSVLDPQGASKGGPPGVVHSPDVAAPTETLLLCPCGELSQADSNVCTGCGRLLRAGAAPVAKPVDRVLAQTWRLERKLGAGGMGVVWLATDLSLDRPVAVKMLHPALTDARYLQRLEREAKVLARLDHPALVPVYAVDREQGRPFIVMKFIEGPSLKEVLKAHGRMDRDALKDLAVQLGEALTYLHTRGVVHRDVKPSNIVRTPEGRYVLLDFGLAQPPRSAERLTSPGSPVGTGQYMAPEQVKGEVATHRADLYALAVTLWEAATGERAFAKDGAQAMLQQLVFVPALASEVQADVPRAFAQELQRAMQKDPAQRHADVAAFTARVVSALGAGPHDVTEKVPPGHAR